MSFFRTVHATPSTPAILDAFRKRYPAFGPLIANVPRNDSAVNRRCSTMLLRLLDATVYKPKLTERQASVLLSREADGRDVSVSDELAMLQDGEFSFLYREWVQILQEIDREKEPYAYGFILYCIAMIGRIYRMEYVVRYRALQKKTVQ